jgi:hypothetical protein
MRKRIYFLLFSLIPILSAQAQQVNKQLWFEYMLNYPVAENVNMENSITYSTLLNKPRWRALDYSLCFEWSPNKYIDLIGQNIISYTWQNENLNSLEIRPVIGTRLYLTPDKRVQTRLLLRLEDRNFENPVTKQWTSAIRPRIRGEVIIPITKKSYREDDMWYSITDAELLFNTNQINERFANRFRVRIGGGYRLSYNLRFEFLYSIQQSRLNTDEDFITSDHIFRFRIKQYLRKNKPSVNEGIGN